MIGGLQRLVSEDDIVSPDIVDSINKVVSVDRSLPLDVIHSFVGGEDASSNDSAASPCDSVALSDDSVIATEGTAKVEITDAEIVDEN